MLDAIMGAVGYGLCHQMPERSFFGGGVQLPVCARDTGIYVGFAVSLAVIGLVHRGERPRGFAYPLAWLFSGAFVGFMAWDGVTSYAGLRDSDNALRLLTGLGTGYAASMMVAPMLNDVLWRVSSAGRVLSPGWRLAVWVVSLPVVAAAMWWGGGLLGVFYPLLVTVSILATLVAINLVLVGMLPRFDRRADSLREVIAPSVVALVIALGEMGAAALFRTALERLVS